MLFEECRMMGGSGGPERKDKDRADGEQDAYPLEGVEPFSEDKKCADERPHGTGRLHGTDDRDRQVLQGEVTADPTTENDDRFEEGVEVGLRVQAGHIKRSVKHRFRTQTRENKRAGEKHGGETDTECEYIYHLVVPKCDFLGYIIKPKAQRRYKC